MERDGPRRKEDDLQAENTISRKTQRMKIKMKMMLMMRMMMMIKEIIKGDDEKEF